MRRRKQENTQIDQNIYPRLDELGIAREYIRRDTATSATGQQRGDLWISTAKHKEADYDKNIISLIECKDHYVTIGDKDWRDAVAQGQSKAKAQNLSAFFVSNTTTFTRCYNTETLEEITLDGIVVTDFQTLSNLKSIKTQANSSNSNVSIHTLSSKLVDDRKFKSSLWNIRQIYRSCSINKGSEDAMIKTSLAFCILKIISG